MCDIIRMQPANLSLQENSKDIQPVHFIYQPADANYEIWLYMKLPFTTVDCTGEMLRHQGIGTIQCNVK